MSATGHEGKPFRSQGAEDEFVQHEWDFQALSEELDRPGEDETFDFEKLFADPWHPRRRTNLGVETNLRPMLRYGTERVTRWDDRAHGRRLPPAPNPKGSSWGSKRHEPLTAQRLTREGAMREVTHLADEETEQGLGYTLRDETLDPGFTSDRDQIDRRIDRFEQAGITSGQTITHGGVHSLIEQHDRWLEDIEKYTAHERLRTGEGL